jgi:hypothetical protein
MLGCGGSADPCGRSRGTRLRSPRIRRYQGGCAGNARKHRAARGSPIPVRRIRRSVYGQDPALGGCMLFSSTTVMWMIRSVTTITRGRAKAMAAWGWGLTRRRRVAGSRLGPSWYLSAQNITQHDLPMQDLDVGLVPETLRQFHMMRAYDALRRRGRLRFHFIFIRGRTAKALIQA